MFAFVLFVIGLVLAVVGGLFMPENGIIAMILALIGIIIGIMMLMKARDINTLLLATIALLAMAAAFAPVTILGIGKIIGNIIVDFAVMMAPIALLAAIKALLMMGLNEKPAKK